MYQLKWRALYASCWSLSILVDYSHVITVQKDRKCLENCNILLNLTFSCLIEKISDFIFTRKFTSKLEYWTENQIVNVQKLFSFIKPPSAYGHLSLSSPHNLSFPLFPLFSRRFFRFFLHSFRRLSYLKSVMPPFFRESLSWVQTWWKKPRKVAVPLRSWLRYQSSPVKMSDTCQECQNVNLNVSIACGYIDFNLFFQIRGAKQTIFIIKYYESSGTRKIYSDNNLKDQQNICIICEYTNIFSDCYDRDARKVSCISCVFVR